MFFYYKNIMDFLKRIFKGEEKIIKKKKKISKGGEKKVKK
jgi:hypothetical protein